MRRVPAILIVIFLAVPLFLSAFFTISISTWALDSGFYATLLGDDRLYEIPDGSAPWWAEAVPDLDPLGYRAAVQASREVLTPAYLRGQALSVVDEVFGFLRGQSGRFGLSVDLKPVKAALVGEPGRRFSQALARDLPVGGAAADFRVGARTLPRFRPASLTVERAAAMIQAGLPAFAASLPDTARLSDSPSFNATPFAWGPGFDILGALVFGDFVLLLFACGFWVAAAFVGGANRYERLQWLGWSLLVPAVGVFLVGLVTLTGAFTGWASWGIGQARLETLGFSGSFVDALMETARHALMRVGVGFAATGAVAAGIALALLGWSWSIPTPRRVEGGGV
jgi:hypothetical protein